MILKLCKCFLSALYNAMQCNAKCAGLGKERDRELYRLATMRGFLCSESTVVEQVVACARVTQRARGSIPDRDKFPG